MPINNNQIESLIRLWALGGLTGLFAGSLHSGKRATATMSPIQLAQINGHDPYGRQRMTPTQRAS